MTGVQTCALPISGGGSADGEFCVTSSRSPPLTARLQPRPARRPARAPVLQALGGSGAHWNVWVRGASSGGLSPRVAPGPAAPISPQPGPGDFPHARWVTPGCGLRLGEEAGARTALAPESGPGRWGQAGAGPTLLEETSPHCHRGGQGRRRGGWRSGGDCRDSQAKGRTADYLGKAPGSSLGRIQGIPSG